MLKKHLSFFFSHLVNLVEVYFGYKPLTCLMWWLEAIYAASITGQLSQRKSSVAELSMLRSCQKNDIQSEKSYYGQLLQLQTIDHSRIGSFKHATRNMSGIPATSADVFPEVLPALREIFVRLQACRLTKH